MIHNLKRKTLVFLLITVILTALIAAALPRLELKPGIPLPSFQGQVGPLQVEQAPGVSISISTFLKAVLEFILVLLVGYGLIQSRKSLPWKEILLPALVIGILSLIALFILFSLVGVHISFEPFTPEILPPAVDIKGPPLAPLPPGLIWLVWGGLAAGIVLLGIWLIRWRTRQLPVDPLELAAQQAILAMQAHLDIRDVIIRCYVQMSEALQKEQGIELKETMTVRDFESLLAARGFPYQPVHQLTGLFETVRYGHRQSGPEDEQQARDCLDAIVQYSRLNRKPN